MDRKLEPKRWSKPKRYAAIAVALVVVIGAYSFLFADHASVLNIDGSRITVSKVWKGNFREYIPVDGIVLPGQTIYLDMMQGGMVEKVYVEDGSEIDKGDTLVKLSNTNLELEYINRETQMFDILNNLQNSKVALEKNQIALKKELAELNYKIAIAAKEYEVGKALFEKNLIAGNEYIESKRRYDHLMDQQEILRSSHRVDSIFIVSQMQTLNAGIARMRNNMETIHRIMDQLYIIAPLSGQLSALDAVVGQLKQPGNRIGQIDILQFYKIKVTLDERYVSRVQIEQTAWLEYLGKDYELTVSKIFPEVKDGMFSINLLFKDTVPEGIKRGQNLPVRMEFGQGSEAIMISRGAFYQSTGGNWIYVLNEQQKHAQKRLIKTGRQNGDAYEILEGLEEGETVITSSYKNYNDRDELVLGESESVKGQR
jgi:HlyD family secretion protein